MNEDKLSVQDRKRTAMSAIAIMVATVAYYFLRLKQSPIMPIIAAYFGNDGTTYFTWAAMIYSLTSCIGAPFWGKMGDNIGKKKVILWLLVLGICGDILSAFSSNIFMFIIANGICGFGGGAMLAVFYATIADLFPPEKRGLYGGYMMSIYNIISIVIPVVASATAEVNKVTGTWRYVYVITSVVYVLAFIGVYFLLPKSEINEKKKNKIDYVGILLITCGAVPFLLALSIGTWRKGETWTSPTALIMLAIAVVVLICAFIWESKHPDIALISVKLLKNRNFVFAMFVSFFMTSTMSSLGTFQPLFVQGIMKQSATALSVAQVPSAIIGIFAGGLSGYLMNKTKRYRWLLATGPFCGALTALALGLVPPTTPITFIVGLSIFNRVFTGYMPSINSLSAMAQIDEGDYGVGGGTLFFITGLGQAIWPALLGSVANTSYASALASNTAKLALNAAQTKAIASYQILLNPTLMKNLQTTFTDTNAFNQTVEAVRASLHAACNAAFFVSAAFSLGGFVLAWLIKEVPLDQIKYGKRK